MYLKLDKQLSEVKWEGTYEPLCTITEVPFKASIILRYVPGAKIIEFIEFEKKVKETLDGKIMIIEDIPSIIINDILWDLNPQHIEVEVKASTPVHNNVESKLGK